MLYVTPSHQFPLGVTISLARPPGVTGLRHTAPGPGSSKTIAAASIVIRGGLSRLCQGFDSESRVICTGTFSKVLFPSLRIGYLVVPPDRSDLVEALINGRVMIDLKLATIPQAALADFIEAGHFTRQLRRMRKFLAPGRVANSRPQRLSFRSAVDSGERGGNGPDRLASDRSERYGDGAHRIQAQCPRASLSAFSLKPVTRGGLMLGTRPSMSEK
jgi:GntR family transcriptional regulator / MocR family aminotransferase